MERATYRMGWFQGDTATYSERRACRVSTLEDGAKVGRADGAARSLVRDFQEHVGRAGLVERAPAREVLPA